MVGTEVPRIEFGAHLPLMTWGDEEPASLADLTGYARLANGFHDTVIAQLAPG
jgi:hypothetical protein